MTLPYLARLFFVCLASFFLIHLLLSILTGVFTRSAVRIASRMKLPRAMSFLIALRVLPAALGALAVIVLCIPSYLTFEPSATREHVGILCCAAAALSVGLFSDSIFRSLRAVIGTWRFTRECHKSGKLVELPGEAEPVLVVDSSLPILTLAGAIRPQLVASVSVLSGLSREELSAALLHERAHRNSRDNFCRLVMMACPRIPFFNASRELERTWSRWAEWQADDRAAEEDPERSLCLASALVHIARMGGSHPMPALCANFVTGENELETRVERLLKSGAPNVTAGQQRSSRKLRAAMIAAIGAGIFALILLQPATLHPVHELLERLIH